MSENIQHTVFIRDKKELIANNVEDVESFGSDYMIINTKFGKLYVEGNGLKMNALSKNEGKITVSGEISGVYFKDEEDRKGFFKRAFR